MEVLILWLAGFWFAVFVLLALHFYFVRWAFGIDMGNTGIWRGASLTSLLGTAGVFLCAWLSSNYMLGIGDPGTGAIVYFLAWGLAGLVVFISVPTYIVLSMYGGPMVSRGKLVAATAVVTLSLLLLLAGTFWWALVNYL